MKVQLNTIEDIKQAVDDGKTVYQQNHSYTVIKDNLNHYFIKCMFNDYCQGLHGMEGTEYEHKLNGYDFYYEKLSDTICIPWSFEDIKYRADDTGKKLTDDESRSILHDINHNHDANIGINWEVIDIYIDNFINSK